MSFVSRGARAAARPLRRNVARQQRRFDSHEAGHGHGHGHGHGESAMHVAPGSGTESFGRGFYIALASIPLFYSVYSVASNPGDNFIARLIKQWEVGQEYEEKKNVIHTKMMEQAAFDRQLFANAERHTIGPDVRFTEMFNSGSPWNVSAGQGTADLTALNKHYEEKTQRQEEARLARRQNGKVVSVYED